MERDGIVTREEGSVVRLSGGNWLSLLSAIVGTGAAQVLLMYGRLVAVETMVETQTHRLEVIERRAEQTRHEFVGEIRALRLEITAQ